VGPCSKQPCLKLAHISCTLSQQAVHAHHSFYGRSWYDVVSIRNNADAPWFAELRLLFHATLQHKTNGTHKQEAFALVRWYADAPTTPTDVLSKSGSKRLKWAAQAGSPSGWFQVSLAVATQAALPPPMLLDDVHPQKLLFSCPLHPGHPIKDHGHGPPVRGP